MNHFKLARCILIMQDETIPYEVQRLIDPANGQDGFAIMVNKNSLKKARFIFSHYL